MFIYKKKNNLLKLYFGTATTDVSTFVSSIKNKDRN